MLCVESVDCPWLDGLELTFQNPEQLVEAIGAQVLSDIHGHAEHPGGPPLKQSTIEAKLRKGQPLRPLMATGGLLDSLLPHHRDNIFTISGDTVTVGTSKDYAGVQDASRPFSHLSDDDTKNLMELVANYLMGGGTST